MKIGNLIATGDKKDTSGANIIASIIAVLNNTNIEASNFLRQQKINSEFIVGTYEDSLLKVKVEQDAAKNTHSFTITGLATGSIVHQRT